jgi:hypothetical protein
MPVRDKFPKGYFEDNPYDGLDAQAMYERIRWGNAPTETFEIDGPEDMATLGTVAMLDMEQGAVKFGEDEAPFLALGTDSNRLYIVPIVDGEPMDIPSGPYVEIGEMFQLDYYSDKGGEDAYYYHEHEEPFPRLYMNLESGVCILEPAEMEDGSRSYAVSDEGVIG